MIEPESIFDAAHYAAVRRPLLEAETLPAWCYTSARFHARELDEIFLKTWLFVGREDEIPAPGDYFTYDTPAGPVLLLRGRDGEVRAFANTCRHRGARLLDGKGNCRRAVVCPYHGWAYGLDGALVGAPNMERTAAFDRGTYGLVPVRLGAWAGFLWITFNDELPDVVSYFGDMTARFAPYGFADYVVTRRAEYRIDCNWKLLLENALEAYHTAVVHGASLGNQWAEDRDTEGNWDALWVPGETSIAVLPGEQPPFAPVPGLEGDLARGTYFTVLYPNTQFACVQDCMWWLNMMPDGPERCIARFGFCFPAASAGQADFAVAVEPYYRRWDTGIREDNETGTLQQAGLRSLLHRPGPYSWRERAAYRFTNWILDQVLDGAPGLRPARAA